jgi:predicted amidohydrolase YtcJ
MSKVSLRVFLFLILVAVSRSGFSQSTGAALSLQDLPPEVLAYPQTILFGGKILTVDDRFSMVQALAIRGERILAVGDDARILKMVGPDTEKIDLQGKTVIPGLIDTHYHLGDYVLRHMLLEEKGIQWEGTVEKLGVLWKDADQALRDIKQAVEAASPGELVRVPSRNAGVLRGVSMNQLDAISSDNPVVIVSASQLRPAAANTPAIEWAKIFGETPGLPTDGTVMISGEAARALAEYVIRDISPERVISWSKRVMKLVNSWGLTMAVTRIAPDQFNTLREIWLQDELTVRWRVGFPGPLNIPQTGNVSDIGDDWLRISGAGGGMAVPGSNDAMGHWSSKLPPTSEEISGWPERRRQILETLRYGWSTPNSHIKGDIAVRVILDVIQEAQRDPIVTSSNQRFTMDHLEEVNEEDIPRMKQLEVIPSSMMKDIFSDQHSEGSSAYQAAFGADYVNRMLPISSYLEAGLQPTVEGDMGDEMLGRPLWTVEKAVCRCVEGSTRIWGRDQKVSRQDALRMKTIWAAAYVGDQSRAGSLEPGKWADLVVLDGDYMSVPEDQIADLPVVLTIVGGKTVYSR